MTLALNVREPDEVDAVTEQARRPGRRSGVSRAETFWGGYSAIFIDPDGHPWEVAHNPHWSLAPRRGPAGRLRAGVNQMPSIACRRAEVEPTPRVEPAPAPG